MFAFDTGKVSASDNGPLPTHQGEALLPPKLRRFGTPVPLGRGATSTVYKMVPRTRFVAKVINCGKSASRLSEALHELRVMRRLLGCPLAVQLEDSEVVSTGGKYTVYIVEEYCTPLVDAMWERSFTPSECVDIAIGVAEALIACRDAGVLHLDIQPKNVFFSSGRQVRLGDFGCSLFVEEKDDRTRLRGTLAFMAPEAFRDRLYSERSDIYSVGVLLYCLLNGGAYPFTNECTPKEAAYRLLAGEGLPSIAHLSDRQNASVGAALSRICAFDPSERPQSFETLRDCLEALRNMLGVENEGDLVASAEHSDSCAHDYSDVAVRAVQDRPDVARKILPIIYAIDTSGSMAGERIAAVNQAMHESADVMGVVSRNNPDIEIGVGVLTFSSEAEWVTKDASGKPSLIRMEDFTWDDLDAGGLTDIGDALKELHHKMTSSEFFSEEIGYKMPVVIFLSDGEPTDNWRSALERINESNKWFRYATKICMAVGDDADKDVLASIAGTPEAVIEVSDKDALKQIIRVVSVSASIISSASRSRDDPQCSLLEGIRHQVSGEMDLGDTAIDTVEHPNVLDLASNPVLFDDAIGGALDDDWGCGWDDGWDSSDASNTQSTIEKSPSVSSGINEWEGGVHYDADPIATTIVMDSLALSGLGPSGVMATCVTESAQRHASSDANPPVDLDKVRFSVIAPQSIEPDEYATIDMAMYEQEFRDVVDQLKEESYMRVQEKQSGFLRVGKESTVRVVLSSKFAEVVDDEQEMVWLGGFMEFSFCVVLSGHVARKSVPFTALVYINNLLATRLTFVVRRSASERQQPEVVRKDVHSAFISYASADRDRVVSLIQGMRAARPDLEIFFDVQSLRVGEDWEHTIMREVERRDVLYLCWSRAARASEYVELEWRHALETKGIDYIEPVPIEPPAICPPPEELKAKHFNDMLLYLLKDTSGPSWPAADD